MTDLNEVFENTKKEEDEQFLRDRLSRAEERIKNLTFENERLRQELHSCKLGLEQNSERKFACL